jgi:hypothetical protein
VLQVIHAKLLALIALIVCSWASPAHGQGFLPRYISESRRDSYLAMLKLSEAQSVEVSRMYVQYEADWSRWNQEISAVNACASKFKGTSMLASFQETADRIERLRTRLKSVNDSFFDQVETVLSEFQLEELQKVRYAHERFTLKRSARFIRERSIDIVELAQQIQAQSGELGRCDTVLANFEPEFIEALRRAAQADMQHYKYEFEGRDIQRKMLEEFNVNLQHEVDRLADAGGRACLPAQQNLVRTIRSGLKQLKAALSPEAAALLQQRYDEMAYPEVYPDIVSADPMYAEALKLETLDELQRTGGLSGKGQRDSRQNHHGR